MRFTMRRAYAMLGLGTAVLFAAASFTLLPNGSQASSTEATFLVPAHDGYGVAECLVSGHPAARWSPTPGARRKVTPAPRPSAG